MTDSAQPNPAPAASAPPASGAQNTGATPSAPTPPRAPNGQFLPSEFRYPLDYHVPELRGRTGEEAASYFKTFYSQAINAAPRQAAQPAPQAPQLPDDTDWLSAPRQSFEQASQALVQGQLTPALNQLYAVQAQTNRALVAREDADVFEKWAPEVDAELLKLDPQYRTYDNIKLITKMVRANHNDEIVQAKLDAAVQARLNAMGGGLRSGAEGAPSAQPVAGVDFNSSDLPAEYRQILASVGLQPRDLPEFLRSYYGRDVDLEKAQKDWFEKAKAGKVVSESRAGWRMERK